MRVVRNGDWFNAISDPPHAAPRLLNGDLDVSPIGFEPPFVYRWDAEWRQWERVTGSPEGKAALAMANRETFQHGHRKTRR